jgi:coronin-1B/1C/6
VFIKCCCIGRLPAEQPLFHGHSSAVLDTSFANFNNQIISSASEDGKVMIWRIPDADWEDSQTEPLATLSGHQR